MGRLVLVRTSMDLGDFGARGATSGEVHVLRVAVCASAWTGPVCLVIICFHWYGRKRILKFEVSLHFLSDLILDIHAVRFR